MRRYIGTITTALVPAALLWALPQVSAPTVADAATVLAGSAIWRVDAPLERQVPPAPWRADDPADSLYRAARDALGDGKYDRAATLFRQIAQRYPSSAYAPDAPYWEAFARYRMGGDRELRAALALLEGQRSRFPRASTRTDAATLATRIQGELARRGDSDQAANVIGTAVGREKGERGAKPDKSGKARRTSADCATRGQDDGDDDSDARLIALNALLHMDSERAMPILREVLARRDACSEGLRRKALFLVAQQQTPDAADILLDAARSDPDAGVRRQAVFWMSQVKGDRATAALDSILRNAPDAELREKAIFALAQQGTDRGRRILREFAQSAAPASVRGKAVFWLGQSDHSPENAAFLRSLYGREQNEELRASIIQATADAGDAEGDRWLVSVVENPKEQTESRKKALFWLGQQRRVPLSQLTSLYDRLREPEVKEQAIFVLSQRRETAATDKLIDIARRDPERAMRNKAIFWLGQRDDPRVKQLLMEIINQ